MKSIVICCTQSSAELYMTDVIDMGYNPILVNPPMTEEMEGCSESFFEKFGKNYTMFETTPEDAHKIVDELKKFDITAVVAGSELGVRIADILAAELGVKGNDPSTTHLRCTKMGMHDALEKAGIRKIESMQVKSEDDIRTFWKKYDIEKAFMKFSEGAGTVGSKMCNTIDEAIAHYSEMKEGNNPFNVSGEDDIILIQEYIGGDEYIVNTVSCNGEHMITDVWKYSKIITKNNNVVYDYAKLLTSSEPGIQDLVRYAYKVLDATGFKYGPCHGEYKVDSKGPVLIETNARPMGASLSALYLDECLGHHITDIALESYLNPSHFITMRDRPYRPLKMAALFLPIVPYDMDADIAPLFELMKHLKTFRYSTPTLSPGKRHYPETIDLETSPIQIKLCGEKKDVMDDIDFLHILEFNYVDLLFTVGKKIPKCEPIIDLDEALTYLENTMRALVVCDDGNYVYQFGKKEKLSDGAMDIYDACIFAKSTECSLEEKYHDMLISIAQVHNGGFVAFMPKVYMNLPFKSVIIELIAKLTGIQLYFPHQMSMGIIYGKKQ